MNEPIYNRRVDMAPFAKARPRVTKNGTYMPKNYTEKRRLLAALCHDMPNVSGKKIALHLVGHRPVPKSASKKRQLELPGTFTTAKPDIDNFAGAVMDALFVEDANVVDLRVQKRWCTRAGISIRIYEIDYDATPF